VRVGSRARARARRGAGPRDTETARRVDVVLVYSAYALVEDTLLHVDRQSRVSCVGRVHSCHAALCASSEGAAASVFVSFVVRRTRDE